jgi:hypothetical protein
MTAMRRLRGFDGKWQASEMRRRDARTTPPMRIGLTMYDQLADAHHHPLSLESCAYRFHGGVSKIVQLARQ